MEEISVGLFLDVVEGVLVIEDCIIIAVEGPSLVEADLCIIGTDLAIVVIISLKEECPSLAENTVDRVLD